MMQRIARRLVISAQDIHEENIFPRMAAQGPGLNLAKADVAEREYTKRFEEYSRHILQSEGNRRLVGSLSNLARAIDQQKARVILLVILNSRQQYASAVLFGSLLRSNGSRVSQSLRDKMAHTSSRVIERHGLDVGAGTKEITALIQGDRMGKDSANLVQLHSRLSNQVMANSQRKLTVDKHVTREQQIEVLCHRSGQRILDGNDGSPYRAAR